VKFVSVPAIAAAFLLLAGCQASLTLAEAQALCTKQGGLLVVIYSQKITQSGPGPVIAKPGHCVSPSQFGKTGAAGTAAPPPAPAPATTN
jgi:hypothetical protein